MDMMRMDTNGKNLACRNCIERKPVQRQESKAVQENKAQQEAMKEYFCKACKYSFKRARHISIKTCPYCSSSGSLMIKGSAARIISDAAKMKG